VDVAPALAAAPLASLLGFCHASRRCSLAGAASPLRARRGPRSGLMLCSRSSGERTAEVRPARCFSCRLLSLSGLVASQALQPSAQLAAPSRAFRRLVTVLQPGCRGIALAATAGESGENKADRQGTFYNRKAELQSLAALLGEPPTAVLVLTGPPSCGKSGVRAPLFVAYAIVVLTQRAMQRCSNNWWPAACNPRVRPSSTAAPAVRAAPVGECAATSTQAISH